MTDNTTPPAERPEFDRLVFDLRSLVRQREQEGIAKAEAAVRNATLVMKRASELFAKGEITGADLTRLHAIRMRLDAALPLPVTLRPIIEGEE